jgi:hypothetical protein
MGWSMERTPHPTRARSGRVGTGRRGPWAVGSWEWAFGPQQQLLFAAKPNSQSVPNFGGARLGLGCCARFSQWLRPPPSISRLLKQTPKTPIKATIRSPYSTHRKQSSSSLLQKSSLRVYAGRWFESFPFECCKPEEVCSCILGF